MSRRIINSKTAFGRFKQIARYYPEIISIISEGDSWFSYPLAGQNLMDHLMIKFAGTINYLRLESTGHEATYMFSDINSGQLKKLIKLVSDFSVPVVLISAGGNDIVGKCLSQLLPNARNSTDIDTLIESTKLQNRFNTIKTAYVNMIEGLIKVQPKIQILAHSYDYPPVTGKSAPITINNIGMAAPLIKLMKEVGPWIKPYLIDKGLTNEEAQQKFTNILIDKFHDDILEPLNNIYTAFNYVDLRGVLKTQEVFWNDEIHPNSNGFSQLCDVFWEKLTPILLKVKLEKANIGQT